MLRLISSLLNRPVMSLQTSAAVGTTIGAIVDPNKLKVVGLHVESPEDTGSILMSDDIREIGSVGIIVDRFDRLAHPEDLVRLKKVLAINYKLIGKGIVTESKSKLGKVTDYIVDEQTFHIVKLYARQSVFQSLTGATMVIDRSQIVEVNDRNVVIKDQLKGLESSAATAVSGA